MDDQDALEWARSEIAAFTAFGQQQGITLSANSCAEIATWLRSLLDIAETSDDNEIERLTRVAIAGRDVLTTLHERFREDIDFIPLWRALIEAGLMPVDPADWVGEEIPVPPSARP